jgi:cytochrome c peroxidase
MIKTIGTCAASAASSLLLFAALAQGSVAQVPPVPVPVENPITAAKAVLGKILFWDEQLSSDNTTACGTCHIPSVGGGDPRTSTTLNKHPGPDGIFGTTDDIQGSRGVVFTDCNGSIEDDGVFFPNPQVTRRKAPSFIGVAWAPELFWDGRAGGVFKDPDTGLTLIASGGALESQAVGPIVSDVEMACAMRTHADVATKIALVDPLRLAATLTPDIAAALAVNPTYPDLFNAAFGDPAVTAARIGMAIATYERTLVPDQTPFDAYQGGNLTAMTPDQIAGFNVFNTNGACNQCHVGNLFTDDSFANIGLRPPGDDAGRFEVTGLAPDMGKFRVPSLRNAGLRAPFFHNGSRATMTLVVNFYKLGGDFTSNLDPRMGPLTISHTEELQLADFVSNALTDPRVALELPPFDRPLLNSEVSFPANFGVAESGTGGFPFAIVAPQPSFLGNTNFSFGVAGGVGGAPAFAALGFDAALPGTTSGLHNVYVDLGTAMLVPVTLGGVSGVAGSGYFTFRWALPSNPAFAETVFFAQFAALDAGTPDGVVVSDGAQFTLF